MAWLEPNATFDPDRFGAPIVGICSALGEHDSGVHQHRMGQVLFTRQGCVRIDAQAPDLLCLLPPTRAAWIPAGIAHRARMRATVDYRSVYLDPRHWPHLPAEVVILDVNPLLRELLERMAEAPFATDWSQGAAAHLAGLCIAELQAAGQQPMRLPLPRDRRLASLVEGLEQLPPPLHELARTVGASEKTIGRLIRRDTGMSYQQWRQQWRLVRAVEQLAIHQPLSQVALELGFASDSAFIAFFKSMTGSTPRVYCR